MRVNTKIIIDVETGAVIERESLEYSGPLAECISFGGSKSKQKSQSQQTSTSESGTKYNQDFLEQAKMFAGGQRFDTARYLKENPDVAADEYFARNPLEHYLKFGQNDPEKRFQVDSTGQSYFVNDSNTGPAYDPRYVRGLYTPGAFTGVAPEGFGKLEESLYGTQESKLSRAYGDAVARQREELSQMGALNSPSQFLEGSARSSLDRNYLEGLQQAARDAFMGRLGAEQTEAGRRTAFDVGEAGRRTAFDTGEAGRETGFNEQTAARLLELWLKKLGIAIESGRYSTATGQGTSQGSGAGSGFNFGLFNFGGSQNSTSSTS